MIAVIDYGMGNLRSVQKAFEFLGFAARVTNQKQALRDASHIVLPGVGAAGDAMKSISALGLREEIISQARSGKPFLGICLGMQLLLDKSDEHGEHECLGLVRGAARPFSSADKSLKIPHMGWNRVRAKPCGLFDRGDAPYAYFVHSYYADGVAEEDVTAVCSYGSDFACGINRGNLYGLQFHPEKSGAAGLDILKRFGGLA